MCVPSLIACFLYFTATFNMLTAFILLVSCVLTDKSMVGGNVSAIIFVVWMLIHIPLIFGVFQHKTVLMWTYIVAWPVFFLCLTIFTLLIYCSVIKWYHYLRLCWPIWSLSVWLVTAFLSWGLAVAYLCVDQKISSEESSAFSIQS
ncbi:uncharacterized protein LOC111079237 [Drosophila obscura]|uniref:uncharacterized protein LOC111079237 n=1 Tax=Drosophila obscura TaxID=7282 RepID=UPI000BA053A2|nr:uncharacterized protein LOC111079237 [Drosophila obscura]